MTMAITRIKQRRWFCGDTWQSALYSGSRRQLETYIGHVIPIYVYGPRRWYRRLFYRAWITATQHSPAFRRICSSGFSRWWTRPPGWCSLRCGSTTSHRSSSNSTGWRLSSGSSSNSLSSCTNVCSGWPTPNPDSDFALLRVRLSTVGDRASRSLVRVCGWNALLHYVIPASRLPVSVIA